MDEGNFPIGLLLICDQLSDPPKILGNFWELHHCKLFLVQSIYLNFGIGSSFVFPNCQGKFCQSLPSQVKWPSQPSRHGAWHAWHGLEAATGPWLVEYQRGIFKKYILHVYWSRCIAQKLWWPISNTNRSQSFRIDWWKNRRDQLERVVVWMQLIGHTWFETRAKSNKRSSNSPILQIKLNSFTTSYVNTYAPLTQFMQVWTISTLYELCFYICAFYIVNMFLQHMYTCKWTAMQTNIHDVYAYIIYQNNVMHTLHAFNRHACNIVL